MSIELATLVQMALPEIVLGAGICLVLLVGVFAGRLSSDVSYLLSLAALVATGWAVGAANDSDVKLAPGGALLVDPVARLLKLFVLAVVGTVFVYARSFLKEKRLNAGDFYLLALFACLGILVMISSASFLSMYLGLETLSLALYAMVASERDAPLGAEAAMKYFVLGAIASGCLLYGISIIYAVTGAIELTDVSAALARSTDDQLAVLAGLVFVVVGVAFKFGAVPFHMWLPDVYHGAPANVALFVATAPKVAAFALALRVLTEALMPLLENWQVILVVLAVLSLGIGNVLAIAQGNLKRMLAYSAIAHVGFILLGFLATDRGGVEAALFYTLVYVMMTAGAFGIIILMSVNGVEASELNDLRGLNQRSPWFAAMMLLIMISMIGVPPLAGFYAKWWVLSTLVGAGHLWPAIAAVLFSVIGAFYYLRVIWLMYFEDPSNRVTLQPAWDLRILLSANCVMVLTLGLFPGALLEICTRALL